MKADNKLEEYMEMALGKDLGDRTKLALTCHYIFSRYHDTDKAKAEYSQNISFCNNSNYPNLTLYNEAEDEKQVSIFYILDSKTEIVECIKKNKNFIDNLKEGIFSKDLLDNFKDLLQTLITNEAFSFEIYFIINDYLQDNEIKLIYDEITKNTDLINYGEFKVFDKKKLNLKLLTGESEDFDDGKITNFGFQFVNSNNFETGLTNTFSYETKTENILLCIIEGKSLIDCYRKHDDKIFEKNIRYSISGDVTSKSVDDGMRKTVKEESEKFFIYNNGITIVTEKMSDPDLKTNTITLTNFSIVNGAQTVSNLVKFANDKDLLENAKNVKVFAKIIESKNKDFENLVEKITKASNNQKPVKPRDFRSNSPEMIRLRELFIDNGIVLDIKRGQNNKTIIEKIKKEFGKCPKILNDELGQIILSLILLHPTDANQKKSKLFADELYNKLFKNKNIKGEYILKTYIFWEKARELLSNINDKLNFSNIQNVKPLRKGLENWIISLVWIILNHLDNLENIVNFKNQDVLFSDGNILFDEKNVNSFIDFKKDKIEEFIYNCYSEISKIYDNNKNNRDEPFTPSAFSFKSEIYEKFLNTIFSTISYENERIESKKEQLKGIFI